MPGNLFGNVLVCELLENVGNNKDIDILDQSNAIAMTKLTFQVQNAMQQKSYGPQEQT